MNPPFHKGNRIMQRIQSEPGLDVCSAGPKFSERRTERENVDEMPACLDTRVKFFFLPAFTREFQHVQSDGSTRSPGTDVFLLFYSGQSRQPYRCLDTLLFHFQSRESPGSSRDNPPRLAGRSQVRLAGTGSCRRLPARRSRHDSPRDLFSAGFRAG